MMGSGTWGNWVGVLLGIGLLGCFSGLVLYRRRWRTAAIQLQEQTHCIQKITLIAGVAIFEFDMVARRYIRFENSLAVFGLSEEELNLQYESFAHLPPLEAMTKVMQMAYHPDDIAEVLRMHARLLQQEAVCFEGRVNKLGIGYIWCRVHLYMTRDGAGQPRTVMGQIADIDEERRCMEGLRLRAETDALSGLHNRASIVAIIDGMLQRDPCARHCLMLLDVDNFKAVNDNLGHVFGDSVLVEISRQLKHAVRGQDFVGRIGGDEFVVFMPHMQQVEPALRRAAELCSNFQKNCSGKDETYDISFSIGLAMSTGEQTAAELIHKADIAMYQAKADGKNQFHLYDGTEQLTQREVADCHEL